MSNLFELAERCLFSADIDEKLTLTQHAYALICANRLSLAENRPARPIADTIFPSRPLLLAPAEMPRRRLDDGPGSAAFFHALAHIEFTAIYLAWDIVYRFRGLPPAFYRDWLSVAAEEALHFSMICTHLQRFSCCYGDLPAHRGLWLPAEQTAHDLLARLALVPRCLEARGLDVSPGMVEKLHRHGDSDGVALLSRIYRDEIGHVERGCYWFNLLARRQGLDSEQHYRRIVLDFFQGKPKGPFNREARIIAGFSVDEIDWLEAKDYE